MSGPSARAAAPIAPAELPFSTATQLADAIRRRRISAVEVTTLALERIARLQPTLNAFAHVLADSALAAARAADETLARGTPLGPLHGVPVAIKDAHGIAGVPNTAGAPFLAGHVPERDSAVVARLRTAGAVILGNTLVPPMLGDWQSFNPLHGTANNPWDVRHTPGGSSGGSAAAVAAGLAWLASGSDIGGSIRVPAHFCGVYGHKPTLGVVSQEGHIPPPPGLPPQPAPELPVSGPLARSAEDLHLAMEVLGGPDAGDAAAWSWRMPAPRRRRLQDFRVGVVLEHPACPLSSDVRAPLESAVAALRRAGVRVTEGWPAGVDPDAAFESYVFLLVLVLAGPPGPVNTDMLGALVSLPGTTGEELVRRAHGASHWEVHRHHQRRLALRAAWQHWFRDHDVMLLPTAFAPAPVHLQGPPASRRIATPEGERPYVDLLWWIAHATLTGLPATTAPVGRTPSGLPVGMQVMGPWLEDATPIEFSRLSAEVVGGFEAPPGT